MGLTVTTKGEAVTRIEFGTHATRSAQSELERRVETELREYFAGKRKYFTIPTDTVGSEFNKKVWARVSRIPYGQTVTYGEIAREFGNDGAARAVGTANGRNPIPIIIPCHRVVAAGGKLGGFGGGLPLKRKLLDLECSNIPAVR
jgi:methylated-DNA-[protein]-cysteine S-methyltransferase